MSRDPMIVPHAPPEPPKSPVMRVTRYDRVSAFLMALVIGLVVAVLWLIVIWATNQLPEPQRLVPVELIELPGGVDEGAVDETLQLQSPEELSADPSLAETPADESQIQEMLETVVELADEATRLAQRQFETDAENAGRAGRADGTGRRALGMGAGETGLPREQRWYVSFSRRATVEEYARQLDHFDIELGALLAGGSIQYFSRLSSATPQTRTVNSGQDEQRLYMTWQGGERRKADLQLLEKLGVDPSQVLVVFHFYPSRTESLLAQLEHDYAKRPVDEIRRTYFVVRRDENGGGYHFEVTRQFYFR